MIAKKDQYSNILPQKLLSLHMGVFANLRKIWYYTEDNL